jgi:hypothetical protein
MKEYQEISSSAPGWGGARPGAGRPAGSPNQAGRALREAASKHTDEALAVLVALMNDAEQPGSVRVAAAQAVLDRGHGRPSQSIETRIEKADVKDMTDAELLAIIHAERAAAN